MSMGFGSGIIDIVILAIILISCYMSYKRGLLLTLYKIISFFLAIWIAWIINPIVKSALIKYTKIKEWLDKNLTEGITNAIGKSLSTNEGQNNVIENLNLPDFVKEYLTEKTSVNADGMTLSQTITENLTNICLTIIAFIIVILVVTIILSLLKGILELISEIPVIESINRIAGLIFGFMQACINIWVIFLIVGLFIDVNATDGVYSYISNSLLGNWFYNNNLISFIILKILG